MNIISLAILILTIALIVFGAILGALRGRNHSILRIIMILVCALVAFFVKDVITEIIMNIEIEGSTLQKEIVALIGSEAEQMEEITLLIVKALVNLMSFVIVFYLLQLITWIILFPIFKLIVKTEKTKEGEVKKQAGFGAIIGLVQGALIALIICAPLTGMLVQFDRMMLISEQMQTTEGGQGAESLSTDSELCVNGYAITYEGAQTNSQANLGDATLILKEFSNSGIAKFYSGVGGWLFDAVASSKNKEGEIVTVSGAIDTVDLIVTTVNEIQFVTKEIEKIEITSPEQSLTTIGDAFINIGNKANSLNDSGRVVFDKFVDVIKDIAQEELEGEGIDTSFIENITFESLDLISVGNAMKVLAEVTVEEKVTYQQAETIIDALYNNQIVFGLLKDTTLCSLQIDEAELFQAVIDQSEFSLEEKQDLYTMFGLN